MIYTTIWMHFTSIMLREKGSTQKIIYNRFPCIWNSRKGRAVVTESRLVVARAQVSIEGRDDPERSTREFLVSWKSSILLVVVFI